MKTLLRLALALAIITPTLAHADEAGRRAKAEHMMELMHVDTLMKQTMDTMNGQMTQLAKQMAERKGMTSEQSAIFTDYMQRVHQITQDAIGWEQLKPIVIKVYVDNFTEEELDGITKFYESPVGQSMITKMPKIMPEMMGLVMDRVKDVQPKIEAAAKEFSEKMKAATPDKSNSK